MSHLLWTTDMSIGCDALDADHRALLDLVRRLDEAVRTGEAFDVVASLLTVALELTRAHSAREEWVAGYLGRPADPEHAVAHARFVAWLRGVRDDFLQSRDRERVRAVLPVMVDWWRHHVMDLDMADRDLFLAHAVEVDALLADSVLAEPILDAAPLRWERAPHAILGLRCNG